MKVLIPTNEGKEVSKHFGRSLIFAVFEIEKNEIISKEMRSNPHAIEHQREQSGKPDHNCKHEQKEGEHDHSSLFSVLQDIDIVITSGIGSHLVMDLLKSNKRIFYTEEDSIEKALGEFMKGQLKEVKDIGEE